MKKNVKYLFIVAIIILSGLFICGTEVRETYRDKECTRENVYQAIRDCGIDNPHVVFAQMSIESGNFGSKLTVSNNNIAGMRMPNKRQTTAVGEKKGYAFYIDWFSSVSDYLLYQKMLTKEKKFTDKQYIAKMSKRYAEDPGYKLKITKKMKDPEMVSFYKVQDSIYQSKQIETIASN